MIPLSEAQISRAVLCGSFKLHGALGASWLTRKRALQRVSLAVVGLGKTSGTGSLGFDEAVS